MGERKTQKRGGKLELVSARSRANVDVVKLLRSYPHDDYNASTPLERNCPDLCERCSLRCYIGWGSRKHLNYPWLRPPSVCTTVDLSSFRTVRNHRGLSFLPNSRSREFEAPEIYFINKSYNHPSSDCRFLFSTKIISGDMSTWGSIELHERVFEI